MLFSIKSNPSSNKLLDLTMKMTAREYVEIRGIIDNPLNQEDKTPLKTKLDLAHSTLKQLATIDAGYIISYKIDHFVYTFCRPDASRRTFKRVCPCGETIST